MCKEKEKGKREDSPHTPYTIREKGKKKKKEHLTLHLASARAHARDLSVGLTSEEVRALRQSVDKSDRDTLRAYVQEIPTIERAISHAALRNFYDELFVRSWYASMDMDSWSDRFGEPVNNWCSILERWIHNRTFFEKLNDPNRIPDARTVGSRGRKADNWRGTRKEDIGDVLG